MGPLNNFDIMTLTGFHTLELNVFSIKIVFKKIFIFVCSVEVSETNSIKEHVRKKKKSMLANNQGISNRDSEEYRMQIQTSST